MITALQLCSEQFATILNGLYLPQSHRKQWPNNQ